MSYLVGNLEDRFSRVAAHLTSFTQKAQGSFFCTPKGTDFGEICTRKKILTFLSTGVLLALKNRETSLLPPRKLGRSFGT